MMSDDQTPGDNDFSDEDFGDELFDDEIQFEDFDTGSGGKSLGELWKTNPLVKVGVVAIGLVCIIGIFVLFGGEEQEERRSMIAAGSDVTETPGSTDTSPEFKKAVEEVNQRRIEEAIRQGTSAMPTPIGPGDDVLRIPDESLVEEDPLERWKRIRSERAQRQALDEDEALPEADPNAPAIEALATGMVSQMESVLSARAPIEPQSAIVTGANFLETLREEEEERLTEEARDAEGDGGPEIEIVEIIIPAGSIEYGQLILQANSDTNGPVLLQLVSGPLAGSRMIGEFEVRNDYLVISFDRVIVNGLSYSTDAIAINPATADVGLVTRYDGRYISRVLLPAASTFVEGFAEAIAQTEINVVASDDDSDVAQETEEPTTEEALAAGFEEAAGELTEIIDEVAGDVEALVAVDAGTPMGILFLEPVLDEAQN